MFKISKDGKMIQRVLYYDGNNQPVWGDMCERFIISSVYNDIVNGEYFFKIKWITGTGETEESPIIPRTDLLNGEFMKYLISRNFSVDLRDESHLTNFVYYAQKNYSLKRQYKTIYQTLGWTKINGEDVFLASHAISLSRKYNSAEYKPDGSLGCSQGGSPEGWIRGVEQYVLPYKISCLCLVLSFVSVVFSYYNGLIATPEVFIEFAGNSSSGKSTMLQLVASVWGNPNMFDQNPAIMNSNATSNAVVAELSKANGTAVCMDETTTIDGKDVKTFIYNVVQAVSRRRCDSTGKVIPVTRWGGALITTTEEPLLSKSSITEGATVRTFSLNTRFTKDADHSDRIKEFTSEHYGYACIPFVYGVLRIGKDKLKKIIKREAKMFRKAVIEEAEIPYDEYINRRSDVMAIILTTTRILNQTFHFGIRIGAMRGFLLDLYEEEMLSKEEKSDYERLKELIVRDYTKFDGIYHTNGKIVTENGKKVAYILTSIFNEYCEKLHIASPSSFASKLKQGGYIYKHKGDRNTCSITINSTQCSTYAVIIGKESEFPKGYEK